VSKHSGKFLFASYAAVVAFLSLLPPGGAIVGAFDKTAHLITYVIFAALAYRAGFSPQRMIFVFIGIVIYSGLLEVGQSFVPGREMSALDLVANACGVVIGALVFRRWRMRT